MSSLPTESGPAGKKYIMGQALCKGDCGRMTRSKHMAAEENPGTVARVGHGKCNRCYIPTRTAAILDKTELQYPILKCTADGCDAMTRSGSDNPALAPGTRRRVSKGMCSACYKNRGKAQTVAQVEAVKSELDAFLAARARRAEVAARRQAATRRYAVAS